MDFTPKLLGEGDKACLVSKEKKPIQRMYSTDKACLVSTEKNQLPSQFQSTIIY